MRVFYRATPTVYNGHLRGLVTLTPIAEHLAMELSLPVLNGRFNSVAAAGDSKTQPSAFEANALTDCGHRRGFMYRNYVHILFI